MHSNNVAQGLSFYSVLSCVSIHPAESRWISTGSSRTKMLNWNTSIFKNGGASLPEANGAPDLLSSANGYLEHHTPEAIEGIMKSFIKIEDKLRTG